MEAAASGAKTVANATVAEDEEGDDDGEADPQEVEPVGPSNRTLDGEAGAGNSSVALNCSSKSPARTSAWCLERCGKGSSACPSDLCSCRLEPASGALEEEHWHCRRRRPSWGHRRQPGCGHRRRRPIFDPNRRRRPKPTIHPIRR